MKSVLTAAALVLSVSAASAEVIIEKAEYAAGITEIRGETSESFEPVTLDGRYSTVSDASGSFQVWLRYLPLDCVINIKVDDEVHPAFISGCVTE
jgi:hypothetical protein